jgi:hypothetical protein
VGKLPLAGRSSWAGAAVRVPASAKECVPGVEEGGRRRLRSAGRRGSAPRAMSLRIEPLRRHESSPTSDGNRPWGRRRPGRAKQRRSQCTRDLAGGARVGARSSPSGNSLASTSVEERRGRGAPPPSAPPPSPCGGGPRICLRRIRSPTVLSAFGRRTEEEWGEGAEEARQSEEARRVW